MKRPSGSPLGVHIPQAPLPLLYECHNSLSGIMSAAMSYDQTSLAPDPFREAGHLSFESLTLPELTIQSQLPSSSGDSHFLTSSTIMSSSISTPLKSESDRRFPCTTESPVQSSGKRHCYSIGCWWEIASLISSITCMTLILAILFAMDGKLLKDWKLLFNQTRWWPSFPQSQNTLSSFRFPNALVN